MRALALILSAVFVVSALPMGASEPTPGVNLSLTRVVPEPLETNDFISYDEARAYLATLDGMVPDYLEVLEVAMSYGLNDGLTGGNASWPVFVVEVTNEQSAVPREEKQAVIFQLSIHGNEKGGREGGLRAIEDLARPLLYGEDYRALLDHVIVVFAFPNVDGWMHEELPYRMECGLSQMLPVPCPEPMGYTRGNGRGVDMNRDWPTYGWYYTGQNRMHALSEPEIAGLEAYFRQFQGRTLGATDIHGMLTPADGGRNTRNVQAPLDQFVGESSRGEDGLCFPVDALGTFCTREGHFVLGLIDAAMADPEVSWRTVRLAERAKEYLNGMAQAEFPYWGALPNLGVAGGEWNEWGTGWDTIGYSDSGFTGDWFLQFLRAPGLTYELSYNHITFDNHYVPEVNRMHVESVRAIVRAFLDEAAAPVTPSLGAAGSVAWLADDRVVRSEDAPAMEGAHLNSTADDAYEVAYAVTPQRFFRDLQRFGAPGTFTPVTADDVAAGRVHAHDVLVIPGDAWELVASDPEALRHLRMHLDQGKTLVLTDSALRALEALGLAAEGSVEMGTGYLGYVNLDMAHAMVKDVRGLARQTYDSIPLGYPIPTSQGEEFSAPIWTVAADALEGGDVAGWSVEPGRASLGQVQVGDGKVAFLGALLPTPTQAHYHPYGLADHAVTYTGYQLLYNAMGVTLEERPGSAAPMVAEETTPTETPRPAPGVEAVGLLAALGAVALLGRRRRA